MGAPLTSCAHLTSARMNTVITPLSLNLDKRHAKQNHPGGFEGPRYLHQRRPAIIFRSGGVARSKSSARPPRVQSAKTPPAGAASKRGRLGKGAWGEAAGALFDRRARPV